MNLSFLTQAFPGAKLNEPLAAHTSFKTGGPAGALLEIETEEELARVLALLTEHGVPFEVIGRGTNILASDAGFEGVILKIRLRECCREGDLFRAGAGLTLRQLFEGALASGFTGLEFAAGIPGTVGGAVRMNAGAYGGEIKDALCSARVMKNNGEIRELSAGELHLGYRTSDVKEKGLIVLSACFRLPRGNVEESRRRESELMDRRRSKQPLDLPSAGSTFRRPRGNFAGTLIQSCGLKGASCGGARVSAKHAGFIVNSGSADAADIDRLIRETQKTVFLLTGVQLVPEVQRIGVFDA